jgi:hypothetical protein
MPCTVWTSATCPHLPLMGSDVCHTSCLKDAFGFGHLVGRAMRAMKRNLAALSAVSYSTMPLRRPSRDLPPSPPSESSTHERAIEALARAAHVPIDHVAQLYAHELAALKSRGAHHRLSHHSHDPEGPRDLASTPVLQRTPLRHLLLAHPACEEESVPEMVCTGKLVRVPVAPTAKTGRPPG